MARIITILKEEGPKYGYYMKTNKGAYLVGKRNSAEEAEATYNSLQTEFGISPRIIRIHPDNCRFEVNRAEAILQFGVNVLGSFIGTDEFIKSALAKHLESLESDAIKLMEHEDLQERMLALGKSFIFKPIFRRSRRSRLGCCRSNWMSLPRDCWRRSSCARSCRLELLQYR